MNYCPCDTREKHPVSECTVPGQSNDEVFAADVRALVVALGLGDHARPYSPHAVIHREVLPALRALPLPDCTHQWSHRGSFGDEWRECWLCGKQEDS